MRKLAFILLLLASLPAFAANLYVAKTGNNTTGTGTQANPWLTIGKAATVVNPGDTVFVDDGTYAEEVTISRSGTAAAPITFKSLNKWGAKIAPTTNTLTWVIATNSGVQYVNIQDFEIIGLPTDATGIRIIGGHTNIIGNKVHGVAKDTSCLSGAGISTSGAGTDVLVEGNWVYDNSPVRTDPNRCNHVHGLYLETSGPLIVRNNVVFETWQGFGIVLKQEPGTVVNPIATNNTVFNNGDDRTAFGQSSTGGGFILDCMAGGCDGWIVANNIVANGQGTCMWDLYDATVPITNQLYTHNLFYNCGTTDLRVPGSLVNHLTSDPQFVNYQADGSGDYHLQATSPAVDSGTANNAPPTDYDGVTRPKNLGYDRGAYELALEIPSDNFRLIIESNTVVTDGKLRWRCERNNAVVMPARTNLFPVSSPQRPIRDFLRDQLTQCIADFTGVLTDVSGGQDPTLLRVTGSANPTNSTTTYSIIPGLTMTLNTNTIYNFQCQLLANAAATTTGIHVAVSAPTTTTWFRWQVEGYTSATALATYGGFANNTVSTGTLPVASGGTAVTPLRVTGGVTTSSVAGDLAFSFKSEIAASAITIYRGSFCVVY